MRRSIISAFRDLTPPRVAADTGIKFAAYLHSFFDRAAVIDALTEAEWVVLSKFGAYLRERARTSIRKGNRKGDPSTPGTPPRSHDVWLPNGGRAKHLLREMMFFGFDANRRTVVVGPAVINAPTGAPGLCEFGGSVTRPVTASRSISAMAPGSTSCASRARAMRTRS
jgi:hypothetical protein